MEKWSEKGHSTRAVQATPAQAFRQPFSACSRWNTGADSRSLRLLQPLVPGASDRPHDRCAPVMPIATPMSESPPSCRLTTPTMKRSWPACSDPPGQRHDKRKTPPCGSVFLESGAGNETRTRDLNLGKVALYQLSYSRRFRSTCVEGALLCRYCCTASTGIFTGIAGGVQALRTDTSGSQATAVEVDLLGDAPRGPRVQQCVERPVGLQMVHRPAQQALAMECRRHLPRHPFRFRPLPTQIAGNRLDDRPAVPPRGVDAAGGQRRDDACRVAGQDH